MELLQRLRIFSKSVQHVKQISLMTIILLLNACQLLTTTPSVERDILPPQSSPNPVVCTASVDGPTLRAKPLSSDKARIELQGLEPGEQLHLIFIPAEEDGSRMESWPVAPIGPEGTYQSTENLRPSPENPSRHWDIQVIHAHGVTCGEITMPE